ncbi:MAG: YggS family pyridoxal phosphate-dependent enzyme [Anaerolineales bacterium]|jgi:pyridoxal phosphate enzyme (YggS family)
MTTERHRIEANLATVEARIAQAAARSGREADEIQLIVVSKGRSAQSILAAYQAGIREIGENRVEEALPKQDQLAHLDDLHWHMVGHIQSRKAKLVAPNFDWVHSVDRLKIARKLDHQAHEHGRRLPVLIECNVSGEESKSGWAMHEKPLWAQAMPEFEELAQLVNLEVSGLMTMAPWTADERLLRSVFGRLRDLREYLRERLPGHWRELSMGMSDDFELAVEEGATMVRIGRAVFGEA